MSVIHTPRKPELDIRIVAFPALAVAALGILFLRLWYFQVVEAPALTERAEASRVAPVITPAPRGLVFDRNGANVATVRPEIVVTAIPSVVKSNPWVLDRVAKVLGVGVDKLERKLKAAGTKPYIATPIYIGATIQAGTKIAEDGQDLPGIGVATEPMRCYPDSTSFTHVMGYVWTPTEDDVRRIAKTGKTVPDFVGRSGIERAYDTELMGHSGTERVEIEGRRHDLRVESRDAATPGSQLVLTLDAGLQKYATQLFKDKGFVGGAVALDPRNGEVLCLVSSPTFDQNLFTGGISDEVWRQLNDDPQKPELDRAIAGAYAPGSTFKIVTTVAAALAGKFDPRTVYSCPGGFYRRGVHLKCLGVHGAISFEEAFAKSCNTYFCNLGTAVGENLIRDTAVNMGLGRRTGIEIGGGAESPGVVPTLKWLRLVSHKQKPPWYLGDTANLAVGQGYMATTPLQMANLVAMVANDGINYKPHLVRKIRESDQPGADHEVTPEVAHQIDLPKPFWAELRRALVGVVDHGTAKSAQIPGLVWAGKTGSAEHEHGTKTHAWFVGFAPAEDPKIAICILIESAGHGGDVAAPIAKDIVERYLMPPKKSVASLSAAAAPAASPASASILDRR